MKWFKDVKSIEELKRVYKKLAMQHHPDVCGDDVAMKEINREYDLLFPQLKDVHENVNGETYRSNTASTETAEEFKEIINALIHLDGITIEVIGSWLWVTGNTYPNRKALKELHFQFSKSKTAWYYHTSDYRKTSNKTFSLEQIRDLYGSQTVKTEPQLRLKLV